MVRKELYCTKSIISKFAVHRLFNSTLSHKGNTLQEYTQFASNKLLSASWFGKTYSCRVKAGSELRSAMKTNTWVTRKQDKDYTDASILLPLSAWNKGRRCIWEDTTGREIHTTLKGKGEESSSAKATNCNEQVSFGHSKHLFFKMCVIIIWWSSIISNSKCKWLSLLSFCFSLIQERYISYQHTLWLS